MRFLPLLMLFAIACGAPPPPNTAVATPAANHVVVLPPANIVPMASPAGNPPTPEFVEKPDRNNVDLRARLLVGADDGSNKPVDAADPRVKRVRQLLDVLKGETKEAPFDIAAAADGVADMAQADYKLKLARQQILEDLAADYASGKIKRSERPLTDTVMEWGTLKYGK